MVDMDKVMYAQLKSDIVVAYVFFVHPQSPTTTPLYRRVAKNPHITLAGLCP